MSVPVIAYVDESGRLADPNARYVALVAVVAPHTREMRKVIRRAGRSGKPVRLKRRGGQEVKWWNATEGVRRRVLQLVARKEVHIFWLVVDKEGEGVPDTPENYGLMFCELVSECLAYYPALEVKVDVHFATREQREKFDQFVMLRLGIRPFHIDSQQEAVIQIADFVAGAVREHAEGKSQFLEIVQPKVVMGKTVKWREIKRKDRDTGRRLPEKSGGGLLPAVPPESGFTPYL